MAPANFGKTIMIRAWLAPQHFSGLQQTKFQEPDWLLASKGEFLALNDPKHHAKQSMFFLNKQNVKVKDWPNVSSDFNPIEHLCPIVLCKME